MGMFFGRRPKVPDVSKLPVIPETPDQEYEHLHDGIVEDWLHEGTAHIANKLARKAVRNQLQNQYFDSLENPDGQWARDPFVQTVHQRLMAAHVSVFGPEEERRQTLAAVQVEVDDFEALLDLAEAGNPDVTLPELKELLGDVRDLPEKKE
jgi:hypothetical protein